MRLFARNRTRKRFTCVTGSTFKLFITNRIVIIFLVVVITPSCYIGSTSIRSSLEGSQSTISPENVDDLLVVNCLLPGQIKRIGQLATFVGPRRPVRTTAVDCAIRGGEYVSYDRSNYKTAQKVWLAAAEKGDKEAQNYLGQIFERGLGTDPDYDKAAVWYRRAADQGHAPAQMNLGKLYEIGLGVPKDMQKALDWYRRAHGLPDLQLAPELQPGSNIPGRTALAIKRLDFGNYHALVIGNNNHKNLDKLLTARSDAETVSEILETKYGFKVTPLYDASRYQILTALNHLRETLTEDDNLLIYYAGHGNLDEVNNRGHWLPVDAEYDSDANWISNVSLTDIFNIMSVRHILVVADSCYSGSLTRSSQTQLRPGQTDEAWAVYYKTVLKMRSRTALSSGGLKPVLDEGSMGHSVFANAFIDILRSNEGVLEGQRLFIEIAARVTKAAYDKIFEQLPEYGAINLGGHEAGDFLLVPKS